MRQKKSYVYGTLITAAAFCVGRETPQPGNLSKVHAGPCTIVVRAKCHCVAPKWQKTENRVSSYGTASKYWCFVSVPLRVVVWRLPMQILEQAAKVLTTVTQVRMCNGGSPSSRMCSLRRLFNPLLKCLECSRLFSNIRIVCFQSHG